MEEKRKQTGYPSIDKPWLKYYTQEAISAPLPELSLYDYFYICNKEHIDDYAINYFGNRITYRKLFKMIDCTAKAFLSIGVKEGDIVSIVAVSTVVSVVCFYALNRIGAVSNFLNVLSEENDLREYFTQANSRVVVSLDLFADKVLKAAKVSRVESVILFSVDYEMPVLTKLGYRLKIGKRAKYSDSKVILWDDFLKRAKDQPEIKYTKDPHTMCLLAHTGGTTGDPKAVMLDDCAMNAVAAYYKLCFKYERGEVWANVMIPFVVYGILTCLHMPLTLGLQTAFIPKFDDKKWKEYFKKYHINYILAVPAYVNVFYNDPSYKSLDLSGLKLCGVGGDGMTVGREEKLNMYFPSHGADIELIKGYGLSEVCATAVTGLVGINKIGSVGIPLIHNNLMIYDNDEGKELPYDQVGEICLQCASRMIGYMNNEDATRQLFRIHDDGSEWLHTGDLGYVDEDGFLFLVGRIKRIILTTKDGVAYKVFPKIPQRLLNEHEAVLQSCVVGVEHNGDQVLRAYIVVAKDKRSDTDRIEQELRRMCEERLPVYARPTFYMFRDSFPLTAAGKVDYRSLENE